MSSSGGGSEAFLLPPVVHNERGEVRKAGFEFEYAGPGLKKSAAIVRHVFGGRHFAQGAFAHRVAGTRYGSFNVEIDTSLLKDRRYEKSLREMGFHPEELGGRRLEELLVGVFSTLVPFEIGTPPIPVTELAGLDDLRRLLRQNGAKGTRASPVYAFGFHINPEIPNADPALLRDYLRAFVLLYPWIKRRAEVYLTRSMSPYINKFPPEYGRLILHPDYPASAVRLIDDYLLHNPTRNRPLDMLPVLAFLDRERVMARATEIHLVKPRPAFHYRLPNCLVDEADWTVAREWNTWVAVERLAHDPKRIAEMSKDYLAAEDASFRPFVDKWPGVLEGYMRSEYEPARA